MVGYPRPSITASSVSCPTTQLPSLPSSRFPLTGISAGDFYDDPQDLSRKKDPNKKKGILRTLFKFGSKKRKNSVASKLAKEAEELEKEAERIRARKMAILEQERIQEHYRKLREQQHHQQLFQQQPSQSSLSQFTQAQMASSNTNGPLHSTPTGVAYLPGSDSSVPIVPSRHERMQKLRAQHQRMHVERQGHYPREDQEDRLDRELREAILQRNQQVIYNELSPLRNLGKNL